jgi:hypothetical protein
METSNYRERSLTRRGPVLQLVLAEMPQHPSARQVRLFRRDRHSSDRHRCDAHQLILHRLVAGVRLPSSIVLRPHFGLVVQNDVQQGTMDFQFPIVFDIARCAEFVHEIADSRSGRADHLRKEFLTEFSNNRLRRVILAEVRKEKENASQSLFARVEQLVDQVFFNSTVPTQ